MSLTDCRLRRHAMHDFEACIPLIAAQHNTGMKHTACTSFGFSPRVRAAVHTQFRFLAH